METRLAPMLEALQVRRLSVALGRKCASQVLGHAAVVGVGRCLLTRC